MSQLSGSSKRVSPELVVHFLGLEPFPLSLQVHCFFSEQVHIWLKPPGPYRKSDRYTCNIYNMESVRACINIYLLYNHLHNLLLMNIDTCLLEDTTDHLCRSCKWFLILEASIRDYFQYLTFETFKKVKERRLVGIKIIQLECFSNVFLLNKRVRLIAIDRRSDE